MLFGFKSGKKCELVLNSVAQLTLDQVAALRCVNFDLILDRKFTPRNNRMKKAKSVLNSEQDKR
jgi:hypothetical protein